MSIQDDMMLMESVLNEGIEQDIQAAFQRPGIGEFIAREFAEATTPAELAMGFSGMAEELHTAMRRGDMSVAKDFGFQTSGDIQWFMSFAKEVIRNAQSYFKARDAVH